jgi:hypothetical protein
MPEPLPLTGATTLDELKVWIAARAAELAACTREGRYAEFLVVEKSLSKGLRELVPPSVASGITSQIRRDSRQINVAREGGDAPAE